MKLEQEREKIISKKKLLDFMSEVPGIATKIPPLPSIDSITTNRFAKPEVVKTNTQIETIVRDLIRESDLLRHIDSEINRYNTLYSGSINPGYSLALVVNLAAITRQYITFSLSLNLVGGLKEEILFTVTRNIDYTTHKTELKD
jgi:hypothetical protein